MLDGKAAKVLQVHVSENHVYQGKPLYEAIVSKCQELGLAGATVFRGLEGYGETAEMHRHRLLHRNQPIVVVVVDEAEKMARLIPELEAMMDSGMLAMADVTARRVKKSR